MRGSRNVIVSLCILVSLGIATTAHAQTAARDNANFFNLDHRWQLYDRSSKDKTTAVLWAFAFPGLGNVYAEQYFLGAATGAVGIFGFIFLGYGLATDQGEFLGIAAVMGGVAYIGGATTAALGVVDYNRELKRGLKLPDERAQLGKSTGFALTLRF